MKYIVNNAYIESYSFLKVLEIKQFIQKQSIPKLILEQDYGDNYFCYIFHDALTQEKKFLLSFSTYVKEDNIYFLFWNEYTIWVIYTGRYVYIIDDKIQVRIFFEITTPLVGMYLLPHNKAVLILEETQVRVIDHNGEILKDDNIGFVESFDIHEGLLSIYTEDGIYHLDLHSFS